MSLFTVAVLFCVFNVDGMPNEAGEVADVVLQYRDHAE